MNCKKYVAGFIVLTGVAVLFGSIAYASHSWGNYHWARSANPFTLKLGDNVSSSWDAYLAGASSDWSASSVLDTTIVAGSTNNTKGRYTPKNCVPTAGRIEVCTTKYGKTGWLGVAQIWASGDHIVQGTAKMNDTYFMTATYNTPAWRRFVMCQEVAHDFGLDHQDETFDNANLGSCMDYTNDPDGGLGGAVTNDPSNEHPNAHDFTQLETIYAHLDGDTTVGQSIFGPGNGALGNGVDGQEIAEWGKAIRTSSDGKPSLFERDLGNGNKLFTFVLWAN
ncbi:MAG: hypothetical protein A2666_03820 [Parcubacteria group bacterium RIFCSPHIGHO2_01_FULL_47_10b]|nr:MAG: hypothetical protein A2666_03820 [Parcubacteria group bacterium RIFCSPHIGHO2_01_FULL_47_10b]